MTTFQKYVIAYLAGQPIRLCGQVIYPADVRRDAELARRVYWEIN